MEAKSRRLPRHPPLPINRSLAQPPSLCPVQRCRVLHQHFLKNKINTPQLCCVVVVVVPLLCRTSRCAPVLRVEPHPRAATHRPQPSSPRPLTPTLLLSTPPQSASRDFASPDSRSGHPSTDSLLSTLHTTHGASPTTPSHSWARPSVTTTPPLSTSQHLPGGFQTSAERPLPAHTLLHLNT
ncbi:hypothetical protein B0J11DRAFT_7229 [Dendryphion nanum]|uniref:Uncharacterized protein n=1 Tax=Dendryphion nanum TaxID=256645 RepID=A0A9P9IZR0_9PLEO|nr:hypothetical protein B0J11DRAFT_7229 [Dendryphion nanum]